MYKVKYAWNYRIEIYEELTKEMFTRLQRMSYSLRKPLVVQPVSKSNWSRLCVWQSLRSQ